MYIDLCVSWSLLSMQDQRGPDRLWDRTEERLKVSAWSMKTVQSHTVWQVDVAELACQRI